MGILKHSIRCRRLRLKVKRDFPEGAVDVISGAEKERRKFKFPRRWVFE